ncbi:hypothetical protein [Sphingomonas sp. Leaf38]|jgi:hypothetical protein|uniref:hypothetical protein n=1 Tax=Sphingomonas sp. Leaf38 TaxID=1736217 RepID=UPI0006FDA664|nr:hypothetical protein [Sphingomonas sp. Leaf38]KQN33637.1 hypothetical protein ASE88_00985 [Sphingomonas sp. Leaf38]
MATYPELEADPEDKNLVILQSLICLLREKNILSRADIEELCDTVQRRARDHASDPLPCQMNGARAAAAEVAQIGNYIGRKYGGKHRRTL